MTASPSATTRPAVTPTPTAPSRSAATHTVEPGQTYYSISKLHGLTVDQLLAMNNLTMANILEVGQQLTVKPTVGRVVQPSKTASAVSSQAASPSDVTYHTVAKGETMFRISQIYGVSIEQIQAWNNLTDVGVKLGQKIKIVK